MSKALRGFAAVMGEGSFPVGGCPITDEREGEGETERDILSMMGDGSVLDEDVLSGLLRDN